MIIGERLRLLRKERNLSQGDIEKRTGLLRCYISRVENGHTIPAVETLEKITRALSMRLYQVLYDGDSPPLSRVKSLNDCEWGSSGQSARYFRKLTECLSRMSDADRLLLFRIAKQTARRRVKSARYPSKVYPIAAPAHLQLSAS
jgi:transcriptional regulator with XRE-family HTH domain